MFISVFNQKGVFYLCLFTVFSQKQFLFLFIYRIQSKSVFYLCLLHIQAKKAYFVSVYYYFQSIDIFNVLSFLRKRRFVYLKKTFFLAIISSILAI